MEEDLKFNLSDTNGKSTPKRSRKDYLIIFVIITLVLLVSMTYMLMILIPLDKTITLREGDFFEYEISGIWNDTIIQGNMNITVTKATDTGFGTLTTTSFTHHFDRYKPDMEIIWDDSLLAYQWVGNERILTPFGDKWVRTSMAWDSGVMVLTQAGCDSSLVYRLIITCPDYFYSIELNATNNIGVQNSDTIMRHANIKGLNTISETPINHLHGEGSGGGMYGSIQVSDNERLRYNLTGEEANVYFFSPDDFEVMTSNLEFSYNTSLSLVDGQGEVNTSLVPGTYWFVFDYHAVTEIKFTYYWRPP